MDNFLRTPPAENVSKELVALGFSVISFHQMAATKPQLVKLPQFLVTDTRNEKSPEILKLSSISQMLIKVEV